MRSSLTNLPIARPYEAIQTQLTTFLPTAQLYLALYLRLIPLPATIQDDIIPVVRLPFFLFETQRPLLPTSHFEETNQRTYKSAPSWLVSY